MLKLKDITIGHDGECLIKDISFEIGEGECILLCGANGCGKSTLMKTLAGIKKKISGEIITDASIVMIPTGIPKIKGFSVMDFIQTGCYRQTDLWGRRTKKMEESILNALESMGIEHLAMRDISMISDGEFQKVCIASAMTKDAGILLLDEPTAFLDVDSRIMVLESLRDITKKKNMSMIFSSHDIYESSVICSRIFGISKDGIFRDSAKSSKEEVLSSCFNKLAK